MLAAVPVMMLATCGGDDGDDSTDKFIAEADAACIESTNEINDLFAEEGSPASFEESVALGAKRLPISEGAVEDVSTIEAPDEVADEYDVYLAEREQVLNLLRQQQRAGEAGDETAYEGFGSQLDEANDAADAAGEEVGLRACAQVLPEDQEEDVRAVIEDTATTGDPAHCTEDYTENFVEASGGLDACEAGEESEIERTESVNISEVKGVDEVYAIAEVSLQGGGRSGQDVVVELVFEDERWKVDTATPLAAE